MAMALHDSRRLTGPNVVWEKAGAVLDIALDGQASTAEAAAAIAAWRRRARQALDALGWDAERVAERGFPGGFSLLISAPIDALYAATEVNEWAWQAAEADLAGAILPEPLDAATARLTEALHREANPSLLAVRAAAAERDVAFLTDDDFASVGMGTGSRTWGVEDLPEPERIPWPDIFDVPIALITGTNGKSTTVRLLAAMARAFGIVAGLSSTDWISVDGQIVDRDDWAGPGGARTVLRDRRVELAILETARGGMLRRGLAVERAEVAAITNIGEDHLGEYGLADLDMLAQAKFVVARAAEQLVLNAEDPYCVARGLEIDPPVIWFGLDPAGEVLAARAAAGDRVCTIEQSALVARHGEEREVILSVDEVPIALGGAARHNLANALTAVAVAWALELPWDAVRAGLRKFESSPKTNPGRMNVFELGGARVIVDFAHNPHGTAALVEMAEAMKAERRLILLGQAGDRDDEAIRELARQAWRMRPDRVLVKELPNYLRGRELGEVPALIAGELHALGAADDQVTVIESELAAVRAALEWAREGDLLLLISHSQRGEVLELMVGLADDGWRPGEPLPEAGAG